MGWDKKLNIPWDGIKNLISHGMGQKNLISHGMGYKTRKLNIPWDGIENKKT